MGSIVEALATFEGVVLRSKGGLRGREDIKATTSSARGLSLVAVKECSQIRLRPVAGTRGYGNYTPCVL
jgi:hypothetical protein